MTNALDDFVGLLLLLALAIVVFGALCGPAIVDAFDDFSVQQVTNAQASQEITDAVIDQAIAQTVWFYDPNHAVATHGAKAQAAIDACGGSIGGSMAIWQNSDTGRFAAICKVDTAWGIVVIEEETDNIWTAFVKEKLPDFRRVTRYLLNAGYHP